MCSVSLNYTAVLFLCFHTLFSKQFPFHTSIVAFSTNDYVENVFYPFVLLKTSPLKWCIFNNHKKILAMFNLQHKFNTIHRKLPTKKSGRTDSKDMWNVKNSELSIGLRRNGTHIDTVRHFHSPQIYKNQECVNIWENYDRKSKEQKHKNIIKLSSKDLRKLS